MKSLEQLERDLRQIYCGGSDKRDIYYLHYRLELISEILIEILREIRAQEPAQGGKD